MDSGFYKDGQLQMLTIEEIDRQFKFFFTYL